jgi:hypothetical protein
MVVRRVSIPADPWLSWVVPVPEVIGVETRPASPRDARRFAAPPAPGSCALCHGDGRTTGECAHVTARALRALALALADDEDDDDWPPFEGPTD